MRHVPTPGTDDIVSAPSIALYLPDASMRAQV